MATKKEASSVHKHDDLLKEIAALKKEVAALQKKCDACCANQTKGGGADPRVDILLSHLLERQFLSEKYCKKVGIIK